METDVIDLPAQWHRLKFNSVGDHTSLQSSLLNHDPRSGYHLLFSLFGGNPVATPDRFVIFGLQIGSEPGVSPKRMLRDQRPKRVTFLVVESSNLCFRTGVALVKAPLEVEWLRKLQDSSLSIITQASRRT